MGGKNAENKEEAQKEKVQPSTALQEANGRAPEREAMVLLQMLSLHLNVDEADAHTPAKSSRDDATTGGAGGAPNPQAYKHMIAEIMKNPSLKNMMLKEMKEIRDKIMHDPQMKEMASLLRTAVAGGPD